MVLLVLKDKKALIDLCSAYSETRQTLWITRSTSKNTADKMVVEVITGVLGSILMTPFLMFFLVVISVSSFGKAFGLRRLYVNSLLKIFEVRERALHCIQLCTIS